VTAKPLPAWARTAAELDGLAEWIDEELAAGQPPKWIARVAAMAVRYIAARLRHGGGR
jgi:antibiotic biosynthesis monooxygenase (ABM) superfamily enzyme